MAYMELDGMPTLDEVRKCVRILKKGKLSGTCGLFRYSGDTLNLSFHELFCHVWRNEEVPMEWKESIIFAICKSKSDRSIRK